jgi:hypothetical protein
MPIAPTRAKRARLLVPSILLVALALALVFAGTALAEVKIGEGTSPEQPALPGEADLLKGTAEYDPATGTIAFGVTTRAALESTPEPERPSIQYYGALVTSTTPCSREAFEAVEKEANEKRERGEEATPPSIFPATEILTFNRTLTEAPIPGMTLAQAYALYIGSEKEIAPTPENLIPASKTVSGTTFNVAATVGRAVNGPFNCAEIAAQNPAAESQPDVIVFPLATKPEPPVQAAPAPPAHTAPAPPAPTAALSIAKAKKPLKLKVGKWATVKVKVTNTGGAPSSPGSLRLKAAKGVVVKAGRQKVPALLPGGSWTVSFRLKLTAKAKKSSTLSLIGAAGSLAAKGSLVVKSLG